MLKRFILATALLLVGCKKPDAEPSPAPLVATPAPVSAWKKQLDEMSAAIKVGMTEEEVVKVVGEPNRTKTLVDGGNAMVRWEYDLGASDHFIIRFDKSSRVASARLANAVQVQQ